MSQSHGGTDEKRRAEGDASAPVATAHPDETEKRRAVGDPSAPVAMAHPDETEKRRAEGDASVDEAAGLRLQLARERAARIEAEVRGHVASGRVPPAAAGALTALLTCEPAQRFDLGRQAPADVDVAGQVRRLLSLLPAGGAVDLDDRTRRLVPIPDPGNSALAAGRATARAARRMLESRGYTVTMADDGATILEAVRLT